MSQIGFVILTHTDPRQVIRLTTALNALYSNPPIVIHHDFSQCAAQFAFPANVEVVQPYVKTQWCGFSVVRATLAGLTLLYSRSDTPDWFVLLSGSCYPAQCPDVVLSDLMRGGYDAFIYHELIDPSDLRTRHQRNCFQRYFSWRTGLPRSMGQSRAFTIRSPLLVKLFSPYSANGYKCYTGSQWFSANRRAAEHILDWNRRNSWLSKHLQYRECPDETYFQTILCNEPTLHVSENTYRFIDWGKGGRSHPKILDLSDLPAIVGSGAHFARKFSPDSAVLDRLDEHLGISCS
jgi:hypothetical protein